MIKPSARPAPSHAVLDLEFVAAEFECFYEKVKKIKADVAAFSYLFLPSRVLGSGKLSRAAPLGNVHLDP